MSKFTINHINEANMEIGVYLRRWRDYSLSFHIEAMQAFKYERLPTYQQYLMCQARDRNKFVMLQGGRGVGKSAFEAEEVWRHSICNKLPGIATKVFVVGPSGSQSDDVSWPEVSEAKARLLPWISDQFILNNEELYCIDSPKSWFASLKTARKENAGSLQGLHGSVLCIFDDGSRIDKELFEVVIYGMTDEHVSCIVSYNPDKIDSYVYEMAMKPKSSWHVMKLSCLDSMCSKEYSYPYIDPEGKIHIINRRGIVTDEFIQKCKDEMGEDSNLYQAYVLGEFASSDSDTLIKKEWIDRAFDNKPTEHINKPIIMGVDVGYERDPAFFITRWGNNIFSPEMHVGLPPHKLSDHVIEYFHSQKNAGHEINHICVDAIGPGSAVAPILQDKGYPAIAVKVNEKSPYGGVQCRRLRDRLWWSSRNFFRDCKPCFWEKSIEMEILAKDLSGPTYSYENGMVVVEEKKRMKKRMGKSPDGADALNLTFYVDYEIPEEKEEYVEDKYRKLARSLEKRRHQDETNWRTI